MKLQNQANVKPTKYLALLRGINVGGNCKVSMTQLREVFHTLGFTIITTYINSGNVIFDSTLTDIKSLTSTIEAALVNQFKFAIKVLIRDEANIIKLQKSIPTTWKNDESHRTDILFLWDDYDNKDSLKLIKTNPDVDSLLYFPGAIAWHVDRKYYNKSYMHKFIGTLIYKNMTARNVNTVRKLAVLIETPPLQK